LVHDLEVRGRLAERVPGCTGWGYGTTAGWLGDVLSWAIETLNGRAPGEPPAAATDAFVTAVNQLAQTRPSWARLFRVAP
jgi:hypothetical protein